MANPMLSLLRVDIFIKFRDIPKDGKKYTSDNKSIDGRTIVGSSRIIDDSQRIVLECIPPFGRYIVDAAGFPEYIILKKFPKLKGD